MNCQHDKTEYRSIHQDSGCSCHINPPCSYCTDQEEYCVDCGGIVAEYEAPTLTAALAQRLEPEPFKPKPCGNGVLTHYSYDGRSGSTMVFTGTYDGEVTNADLLAHFGSGTFGHRFGYCQNGRFQFTKITD